MKNPGKNTHDSDFELPSIAEEDEEEGKSENTNNKDAIKVGI